MSKPPHCPLCAASMERRLVAPCMDCGAFENELEHFTRGIHTYAEWRLFPQVPHALVLCDFCEVDFQSYDPAYFGLPPEAEPGRYPEFVRDRPEVQPVEDWVCPECLRRKGFLEFVARVRAVHAA